MTDSQKLDFLVESMARQEKRMDSLEENLMGVRSELKEEIQGVRSELKEEIQEVRSELTEKIEGVRSELKEEIQGVRSELKGEIQELREDVTDIKLVIENELRRNISIVAEGHLDLMRKLDESIKVQQEQEKLMVRVNVLETYVKELKKEKTA